MKLRPYQQDLIDGVLREYGGGARRVAAVMATGGGKTPTAMTLADQTLHAGAPVLWIAHRTELIDQAVDKARQVARGWKVGRMQGIVKEWTADIVVASVQTASTKSSLGMLRARRWGMIVIDETHHAVADTYLRVVKELRAFEPDGPLVLGITATLNRGDRRALGDLFEAVAEPQIGLIDLIRQGFLVRPRGVRVRIRELDLANVKRTAGDLNSGQLARAMTDAMAPQRIVDAWREHAKGRPTMAFLPSIDVSKDTARAYNEAGFAAVHLDGSTPASDRAAVLQRFRDGAVEVVCNVGLFTEGTDLPNISCVVLGRPTSSTSLYQQMVGRGLRLHPGKDDCVVLDVVGNSGRHKMATLVSLSGAPDAEDVPDDLLMYEEDAQELDEPADAPEAAAPVEYVDGELDHELVDLFGQAHSAWLRTPGGTWFVPTSQGTLYLERKPGDRYDLCWWTPRARGVSETDMEIGYAMARGDEIIAGAPHLQMSRDAAWRSRPGRRPGRTAGEEYDDKARTVAAGIFDR